MFVKFLRRSDVTSNVEQKEKEEKYYSLETFASEPKSYSISGIKVKQKDGTYKDSKSTAAAFEELINEAATSKKNASSILSDIDILKKAKVSSLVYRFVLPEDQRKVVKNEYKSFTIKFKESDEVGIGNSFSQNAAADNLYKLLKLLDYSEMDKIYVKGIYVGK